jgi:type IV secretion system protein VirB8
MNTTVDFDKPLPRSARALKAIAQSDDWDTDTRAKDASSRRTAWLVAGAGVLLAVLGFAMAVFQSMRPAPAPVTIVMDRTTGESHVVSSFDADSVPELVSGDRHWAAVFVRARESYYFNLLQSDYNQVARMTVPETWTPYSARFVGENAMQTKVGTAQEHRVTIVSVRMSSTTKPGRFGEAIVTYDKEIHNNQGQTPPITRYVATVRYEYRPRSIKTAVDQNENPFGFVVLSYRADAELVAPAPAPAPAGAPPAVANTEAQRGPNS